MKVEFIIILYCMTVQLKWRLKFLVEHAQCLGSDITGEGAQIHVRLEYQLLAKIFLE